MGPSHRRSVLVALLLLAACGDRREPAGDRGGGAKQATPEAKDGEGKGAGSSAAGAATTATPTAPGKPAPPLPPLPADAGAHTGKPRFARRFGSAFNDAGRAVAIDAAGNVAVAGYVKGPVDLGGGTTLPAVDADGFVALFAPDGALRWARGFGGAGDDAVEAVAFDGEGNVLIGGGFSKEIAMADGKLESHGADDMFVIKLAPDGRRLWAKRFGGIDVDAVYGVAVAPGGDVYVTGEVAQAVTIGGVELPGQGASDMLVMRLAADGKPRWSRRFGSRGVDLGRAVRASADGGVVVLGEMSRAIDFGGGEVESTGNRDVVALALDADGGYRWATHLGGIEDELAIGLAIDPAGAVLVTGTFDGTIEVLGATHRAAGQSDAFVAKLGAGGAPRWFRSFGSKEAEIGAGVTTDAAGNVYAVGWFWYEVDFGKGALTSAGKKDSYALALAPDGGTLWARRFGAAGNEFLQAVASGPQGLVAVGTFHGEVAYGSDTLTALSTQEAPLPAGDVVLVGLER